MPAEPLNGPARWDDQVINWLWRRPAEDVAERARRRVTVRLLPFLLFLYILAYLDRQSVANAELKMCEDPQFQSVAGELYNIGGVGFTAQIIGFGSGIFFVGYLLLEIPSSMIVVRYGAKWNFVRILILWGLACVFVGLIGLPSVMGPMFSWIPYIDPSHWTLATADALVGIGFGWIYYLFTSSADLQPFANLARFFNQLETSPEYQFYFFRFLLGVFEGGFFPSVIVYLSVWFRQVDRARAIAMFMIGIPLSGVIGGPLSGLMLNIDWLGLPGWRWVFILQGIIPVLTAFVTPFLLPDRPSVATWLREDERTSLVNALAAERKDSHGHGHFDWLKAPGLVLLLTVVYFCFNVVSYGVGTFLPAMLKSLGAAPFEQYMGRPMTAIDAAVLTAFPYALATFAMLFNSWHSDRYHERVKHVAVPLTILSGFLFLTATLAAFDLRYAAFCTMLLAVMFLFSHLPCYWPIPSLVLGTVTAASATGFINMFGNLGGFVGPTLIGKVGTESKDIVSGIIYLAPWPLLAVTIITLVGHFYLKRLNTAHTSDGELTEPPADSPAAEGTDANSVAADDAAKAASSASPTVVSSS